MLIKIKKVTKTNLHHQPRNQINVLEFLKLVKAYLLSLLNRDIEHVGSIFMQ